MKEICEDYSPTNREDVQKRIAKLTKLGYLLKNRAPSEEEIKACTPFLDRQIAIIKPGIICTLGNFSTSYILDKFGMRPESIGKVHGKVFSVHNLMLSSKIVPLHHPAAALRNPDLKSVMRGDFRVLKGLI
ncbi:MAG: uracil-DNA glycosylase [Candidatus Aenigmarchaeota archaeon]|nr:uracil-DNA glycosylase [Candidatus Aenigmarchaeota archaeon]